MALLATSCQRVEMDRPSNDRIITVIGRVTSFESADVSTKANKVGDEKKISNMTMFVIDGNGHVVNTPEYQSGDSEYIFTVNRDDYAGHDQSALKNASIHIFANVPETKKNELTSKQTLDDLYSIDLPVSGIDEPVIGFPMVGHLDVDLSQSSDVKGEKQIPLRALYAKVVFTINVDPIQMNPNVTQRFQMKSWSVHNVPNAVNIKEPGAGVQTKHVNDMQQEEFKSSAFTGSNPVTSAHTLTFSFYVPEHKINPTGSVTYPFADTPENAEFKQHFKPALVNHGENNAQNATYVVINGDFYDHNGRRRDVTYTVYLGGNNYDDFYLLRDHQYNNYVTIRGLSNNTSVSDKESVSYDWRVDVEQTEFKFELERETLIDSHWEIRPIRITLDYGEHPGSKVVVSIKNPSTSDWLRMEMPDKPGNTDLYCTNVSTNLAYGKRKYFTTDLVNSTLRDNTTYTIHATPTTSEHTIWMYIDEYVDKNAGNVSREAVVKCEYYNKAEDLVPQVSEEYTFIQKNIHSVTYNDRTYFIEYFEEYLYNFDSKDKYDGLSDGMKWGLENVELSNQYSVAALNSVGGSGNNDLKEKVRNGVSSLPLKYDFYMQRDIDNNSLGSEGLTPRAPYSGKSFTEEISKNANAEIGKLATNQPARSAVEYCVNRNKRNNNGDVDKDNLKWYLPAIDEIEEICKGGYSEFEVFQDKLYWSSQPAFKRSIFEFYDRAQDGYYLPYFKEDSGIKDNANYNGRARATKVNERFENVKSESYGIQHATSAVGTANNRGFDWVYGPNYFDCYEGKDIDENYQFSYWVVITTYRHKFNLNFSWHNPTPEQKSYYYANDAWKTPDDHNSYTISYQGKNSNKNYNATWKDWYYFYDEGNCSRDEIHRVRCVYAAD